MPRIRSIKPDFFTNEGMARVSAEAQLLAGGLLCYADDEGYFNAHPALVKAAVFPLRETAEQVSDMLSALARIGYVHFGLGEDGKRYGHIVKFAEHQKVSHMVASKIKKIKIVWEVYKNPPEDSGGSPEDSVRPPAALRPELNRTELNRTELKNTSSRSRSMDEVFKKAYEQYPRKVGRGAAAKAWPRAVGRHAEELGPAAAEIIYQRVMTYAAFCKRSGKEKQFTPHMATWLNEDRFLDDPTEWAVTGGNGNGQTGSTSKANDREQRVIDRARRFSGADAAGEADSAGADPVATSGNGGSGISGLAREPEIISPGKDSGSTRPPDDRAAKATAG